jgi:hypothetical protein
MTARDESTETSVEVRQMELADVATSFELG